MLTTKLVKLNVGGSQIGQQTMWDEKLHVISGLSFSCNILNRTLPQTHETLVLFGKRLSVY